MHLTRNKDLRVDAQLHVTARCGVQQALNCDPGPRGHALQRSTGQALLQ